MKKDYLVLDILNKKEELNAETGETETFCEVLWGDYSKSWTLEKDISDFTKKNCKDIKDFNEKVKQKASSQFKLVNPKKAFIYARISSKQNNMFSESIDTQFELALNYCLENLILVEFKAYDECSGRDFKNYKKELGTWSNFLKPNEHIFICYTPDRIGRCLSKCATYIDNLINQNIDIIFIKENILLNKSTRSDIRTSVNQQLIQAETFSNMTRERIINSNKLMKARGHYLGSAPYGYMTFRNNNGIRKLKINVQEKNIIKEIISLHRKYQMDNISKQESYKKICNELKNKNVKLRNKEIKLSGVRGIINRYIKDSISNTLTTMTL